MRKVAHDVMQNKDRYYLPNDILFSEFSIRTTC